MTAPADRGELAIVLHTHMPYVEGYGTWPFGEEWLWEAMATSYLPLLDVLGRAPLTLSLTPVLCDQLEAPGVGERFLAFLADVREETHRRDIEGCRNGGEEGLARELERAAGDYRGAAERFERIGGDLLGALAPHVSWTSSATHAVLPLLATEEGLRLQLRVGIDSHRRRFGDWHGGFWLPECAYSSWIDEGLEEAGVHCFCVDLTDHHGPGAVEHLAPRRTAAGPIAVPIDRTLVELVWNERTGYPAHAAYRDYHHHTIHHHRPWANDGSVYDHRAALALAGEHAADFVARTMRRLEEARDSLAAPPLAVFAIDTELLGHWWYEGVAWLDTVICEAEKQGLALTTVEDAVERRDPAPAPASRLPASTWGEGRDLSTWSGPAVADLAFQARAAELDVVAGARDASPAAVRELLALQASDWAFMASRRLAGDYPRERAQGHAAALRDALAGLHFAAGPRNLAPHATAAPLLAP